MPLSEDHLHALLDELERLGSEDAAPESLARLAREVEPLRQTLRDLAPLVELLEGLEASVDLPMPQLRETLQRILPLAAAQSEHAPETRRQLIDTLTVDLDVLDPVPHATVAQARRVAETRNRLLSSGAWTVAALAEARGVPESTVRTWLARQRAADRLVSVTVGGEAYVPAVLLDATAEPYHDAESLLRPLRESGMDPWAVWLWLDSPSAWLDGERPADVLTRGEVAQAATAARAQAANTARGSPVVGTT